MQSELSTIAIFAPPRVKNVLVCDAHPVTVAGVKALISGHEELRFADSASSLIEALDIVRESQIDVVLVEKTFGWRAIEEFLASLRQGGIIEQAIVIWGGTVSEDETMRFMHAGARGGVLKTTEVSSFVACLRAIAHGRDWMDGSMLGTRNGASPRNTLTERERQVFELIQHGFTNKPHLPGTPRWGLRRSTFSRSLSRPHLWFNAMATAALLRVGNQPIRLSPAANC